MEPFDVEILRTGKWQGTGCPKGGCEFTEQDLTDMVANFQALREEHKVPLKRGHTVEVGDVALGWVEELRIDGDRLIGKFGDVPDVVREAIKKKLFRKVSIEAMKNVVLGGKKLKGWVLDAVALLGAEIPAVSGLKDLDTYLASRSLEHGAVVTFSTVKGNLNEQEQNMDEEMKKRLDAIESRQAASDEKNVKLSTENEALKAENAKMKREKDEAAANERKGKIELNRKKVTDILEKAVKDKLILPAQRETFSKLLKTTDDAAMEAVVIEDVEKLVEAAGGGKKMKFTEQGRQHDRDGDKDRVHEDAGDELHRLAVEFQDAHPKMQYHIALERVMQTHPDLAIEHIGGINADKEAA